MSRAITRPLRLLVLVCTLLLLAPACSDDSSAGPDSFKPVTPGVLTVATSLPATGFWQGDSVDHLDGGFEWAIAHEIANTLGLELVVRDVDLGDLVAGRVTNYDVAFSQITVTTERSSVVDFTTSYYSADLGVLVRKGTAIADLATARRKRWVVRRDTTEEDFVADVIRPDATLAVETFGEMIDALRSKTVDAALFDTPIALAEAHASGSEFAVPGQFRTGDVWAGVLPKGSSNQMALNAIIRRMQADGTLDKFADKWLDPVLGRQPADVPVIVAKEPRR